MQRRQVTTKQIQTSPLQQALDGTEIPPVENQETLPDLVQHRSAGWRRTEIAAYAAATPQAVREGRASLGSVEDLKRDLLNEQQCAS